MTATVTHLYKGHDPAVGCDFLLTVWSDGGATLDRRPGKERTDLTWEPVGELERAS